MSYFPLCISKSIIGAEWFHYRVRNGIVCVTSAITAKPIHYISIKKVAKNAPLAHNTLTII